MAKKIKLPLSATLSYRELNDIIASLKRQRKAFKEVDMKRPAYDVGHLLKKMERIYKKCNLKMTLIYKIY